MGNREIYQFSADVPEELGETLLIIQLGNKGAFPGQWRHIWGFRETCEVRIETYGEEKNDTCQVRVDTPGELERQSSSE